MGALFGLTCVRTYVYVCILYMYLKYEYVEVHVSLVEVAVVWKSAGSGRSKVHVSPGQRFPRCRLLAGIGSGPSCTYVVQEPSSHG
jgi:hypothetical protein